MHTISLASCDPLPLTTTGPTRRRLPAPPRISPFRTLGSVPSALYERQFRADIAALKPAESSLTAPPRRGTISVLMSALRAGNTVADLLDLCRGVSATELQHAYLYIENRRCDAVAAFDELQAIPTLDHFHQIESRLQPLFPRLCQRLHASALVDEDDFFAVVEEAGRQSRAMEHTVYWIEEGFHSGTSTNLDSLHSLDDGRGNGVYHHANYRPRRLGEIVPDRLASLLGESDSEVGR